MNGVQADAFEPTVVFSACSVAFQFDNLALFVEHKPIFGRYRCKSDCRPVN
jgi:hypothetical protein